VFFTWHSSALSSSATQCSRTNSDDSVCSLPFFAGSAKEHFSLYHALPSVHIHHLVLMCHYWFLSKRNQAENLPKMKMRNLWSATNNSSLRKWSDRNLWKGKRSTREKSHGPISCFHVKSRDLCVEVKVCSPHQRTYLSSRVICK
jgi:hypothetical protein